MVKANNSTPALSLDKSLSRRAEFRAILALEGSAAVAGRHIARTHGDPAAACKEMLGEHLTVSFLSTQAALDMAFGPNDIDEARDRARVALGLQRASILMRRNRLLQALAERDDVLQHEVTEDQRLLAGDGLDDDTRASIEANMKIANVCRADLTALARLVLEQMAMRDHLAERGSYTFDEATLEAMAEAAEQRVMLASPAIDRGVPLRRALAADLADEGQRAQLAAAMPQEPRVAHRGITR